MREDELMQLSSASGAKAYLKREWVRPPIQHCIVENSGKQWQTANGLILEISGAIAQQSPQT